MEGGRRVEVVKRYLDTYRHICGLVMGIWNFEFLLLQRFRMCRMVGRPSLDLELAVMRKIRFASD